MPKADEWTISRWRTEPRLAAMEFTDPADVAPPLWKDLMVATLVALVLWAAAAIVFA